MSAIGRRQRSLLVLLLIVSAAIPIVHWWSRRQKEKVLHDDLVTMRGLIQQYTLDKQKAPQTLEDLIHGGYMREIPKDPFTKKADWTLDVEDALPGLNQVEPGIWDVHSRSEQTAVDGTKYSDW
jgi:general secretion pathway protein G